MRKTLAKLTSILLFASIVLFVPSMTVFADEGDEGNTVITTDSTTNGYVADGDTIWFEANTKYFTFYDNLYTDDSHLAITLKNLAEIIPIDMNHSYQVNATMRVDKTNQATQRFENVGNISSVYGYTVSNAMVYTDISFKSLYDYEKDNNAIAFELVITDMNTNEVYNVNYVMPSLTLFTDFYTNYMTVGDLKANADNTKNGVIVALVGILVLIIILSIIIVGISSFMEKRNAKRNFVKIIYLPYQIFSKIKKNTDNDMIFRLQHTNKQTGIAEFITVKRILDGNEEQEDSDDSTDNQESKEDETDVESE